MRRIDLRGLVLALCLPGAMAAPACRQPRAVTLVERFVPADCEACWKAADVPDQGAVVLDWIVPTTDNAAMSAVALPEATPRAAGERSRRTSLSRNATGLRVADGPAWINYIGMSLTATRGKSAKAGDTAWLALVERVPAGSEGTDVDRQLVRTLVGPLTLDELKTRRTLTHLRSVRLPETQHPERLASVGWIENANGQVVSAAQTPPAGCTGER